jgi:formylmethanofuran dehydrogenase subunit B
MADESSELSDDADYNVRDNGDYEFVDASEVELDGDHDAADEQEIAKKWAKEVSRVIQRTSNYLVI